MKSRRYSLIIPLIMLAVTAGAIPSHISVFYSQSDKMGWKAIVKGRVLSFTAREDYEQSENLQELRPRTCVTVHLTDPANVRKGDTLFVINDRNLIVSRIKVWSVFPSQSFGTLLVGYGTFDLATMGDRVVMRLQDEYSSGGRIFRARGDYYRDIEEPGKAVAEYKKAIEVDRANAEAHMGLGLIYHRQEIYPIAMSEYLLAYRDISRIADMEDRFVLLSSMADIRFREVFYSNLEPALRKKYREEGKRYCREALLIDATSARMNYLLGRFHYEPSSVPVESDRTARDYFLRAVELEPGHSEANTSLAELYFKYGNTAKARRYATRALETDPSDERARQILKYLDQGYNRR